MPPSPAPKPPAFLARSPWPCKDPAHGKVSPTPTCSCPSPCSCSCSAPPSPRPCGAPLRLRNRVGLAANLKQIGEGMLAYAKANAGAFPAGATTRPATRSPPSPPPTSTPRSATTAPAPTTSPPAPSSSSAAATCRSTPSSATAPSTLFWDFGGNGKTAADHANFPDADHLSYSFQNPYPTAKVAEAGFRWTTDRPAEFVLAADRNDGNPGLLKLTADSPAADLQKSGNSDNHNRDGQNVLFADGHVDFRTTPFCGIDRDNIYTAGPSGPAAGGTAIRAPPAHPTDNVLLPATEHPGGL